MFERKVLRKFDGPYKDESIGEWKYAKTRNFRNCIKDQSLNKILPK